MSNPEDFNGEWHYYFASLISAIRAGAPRLEKVALRQIRRQALKTQPQPFAAAGEAQKAFEQQTQEPND